MKNNHGLSALYRQYPQFPHRRIVSLSGGGSYGSSSDLDDLRPEQITGNTHHAPYLHHDHVEPNFREHVGRALALVEILMQDIYRPMR